MIQQIIYKLLDLYTLVHHFQNIFIESPGKKANIKNKQINVIIKIKLLYT